MDTLLLILLILLLLGVIPIGRYRNNNLLRIIFIILIIRLVLRLL